MRHYGINLLQVAFLGLTLLPNASASRLLIDDFSISQEGILTDQNAAFDLLEDPRLFGGSRELFGGGNSDNAVFSATVNSGSAQFDSSQSDAGSGVVRWSIIGDGFTFDASEFQYVDLHIKNVRGDTDVVLSFQTSPVDVRQIRSTVAQPGVIRFQIPPLFDLGSVHQFAVGVGLEANGFMEMDAVWLSIPEPCILSILLLLIPLVSSCRALPGGHYQHRISK